MTEINCPDCNELVTPAVYIPTCDFNKDGKKTTVEHETCEDDFCNPSEFAMNPVDSIKDFESHYYRCSECKSLNIDSEARAKKEIVGGGCTISDHDPKWECNSCQHTWGERED